jgi:hypothetical protein
VPHASAIYAARHEKSNERETFWNTRLCTPSSSTEAQPGI